MSDYCVFLILNILAKKANPSKATLYDKNMSSNVYRKNGTYMQKIIGGVEESSDDARQDIYENQTFSSIPDVIDGTDSVNPISFTAGHTYVL